MWDNSTRAELKDRLRESRAPEGDAPLVQPFAFSAHEGLLRVGDLYLQIYNEQPDFTIEVSLCIHTTFSFAFSDIHAHS